MLSNKFIDADLPHLSLTDTGNTALHLMAELHLSQIALVHEQKYLGIVTEENLLNWQKPELTLAAANFIHFRPAIVENTNILDVAKLMLEFNLQIVPVIDHNENYIGSITLANLFTYLAQGTQCMQEGSTIVLEVEQYNFSFSEIARICEGDNVSILSILQHQGNEPNTITISIKTNKKDIKGIVATLERYNYKVLELQTLETEAEDLKNNYDLLMNFINM